MDKVKDMYGGERKRYEIMKERKHAVAKVKKKKIK